MRDALRVAGAIVVVAVAVGFVVACVQIANDCAKSGGVLVRGAVMPIVCVGAP